MTASALRSGIRNGRLNRWPSDANVLSRETAPMMPMFLPLLIAAGRLAAVRSRRHAE